MTEHKKRDCLHQENETLFKIHLLLKQRETTATENEDWFAVEGKLNVGWLRTKGELYRKGNRRLAWYEDKKWHNTRIVRMIIQARKSDWLHRSERIRLLNKGFVQQNQTGRLSKKGERQKKEWDWQQEKKGEKQERGETRKERDWQEMKEINSKKGKKQERREIGSNKD